MTLPVYLDKSTLFANQLTSGAIMISDDAVQKAAVAATTQLTNSSISPSFVSGAFAGTVTAAAGTGPGQVINNDQINNSTLSPSFASGSFTGSLQAAVGIFAGTASAAAASGSGDLVNLGQLQDSSLSPSFASGSFTGTVSTANATSGTQELVPISQADSRYLKPPQNILPNTQWQICSNLPITTKFAEDGSGPLSTLSISSYTSGTNYPTFNCSNTGTLSVGDLVVFGGGAESNLTVTAIEVDSVTPNVSFSGYLPRGLSTTTSAAITATINMNGDVSGTIGNGADGWVKTTAMWCWRDLWPGNIPAGALYAMGLKQSSTSAQNYFHHVDDRYAQMLAGESIVFGAYVWHKTSVSGGSARLFVNVTGGAGMVYSSPTTGTSGYEYLEISVPIASSGVTGIDIGVELSDGNGGMFYFANPMASRGQYLGSGSYAPIQNELFIPDVKTTAISYVGATVNLPSSPDANGQYGFEIRVYPETNGAIAPNIKEIGMQLEGYNAAANVPLGIRNVVSATTVIYGVLFYTQVAGQMITTYGRSPLSVSPPGTLYLYTTLASEVFNQVSLDFNTIMLN